MGTLVVVALLGRFGKSIRAPSILIMPRTYEDMHAHTCKHKILWICEMLLWLMKSTFTFKKQISPFQSTLFSCVSFFHQWKLKLFFVVVLVNF